MQRPAHTIESPPQCQFDPLPQGGQRHVPLIHRHGELLPHRLPSANTHKTTAKKKKKKRRKKKKRKQNVSIPVRRPKQTTGAQSCVYVYVSVRM